MQTAVSSKKVVTFHHKTKEKKMKFWPQMNQLKLRLTGKLRGRKGNERQANEIKRYRFFELTQQQLTPLARVQGPSG